MITGIVVKNMNGYFYVQDDASTVHECKVRGRLKKVATVYLSVIVLRFLRMDSLSPSSIVIIPWF